MIIKQFMNYLNLHSNIRLSIVIPAVFAVAIVTVLASLSSTALVAQVAQEGQNNSKASQRTAIEEVIVTAQRREESLQDTPLAVTAFTAEDLAVNNVIEFGEVANLTPGFTVRKQAASHSNYAFGVRGITSGETVLSIDSVVALYIDNVYMGRLTGSAFDISDTERVEFLRGPQGTLYGRNATGGAINIISAKPDRAPGFRNSFTAADRGYWRNQIGFDSGAAEVFGGELMLRGNFSKWNHNGLLRNIARNGELIGDQDSEASRFSIAFEGGKFSANYTYDSSEKLGNSQITQINRLDNFTRLTTSEPASGIFAEFVSQGLVSDTPLLSDERSGEVSKFYDQPESSDVVGHSLNMSWDLPRGYKFVSITGVREWDSVIADFGTDFGSVRVATATQRVVDYFDIQRDVNKTAGIVDVGQAVSVFRASRNSEQDQYTQEFQLHGVSFNDRLKWLVGAYYFEEDASENNSQYTALPGSALPFVGGVASAFDADVLLLGGIQAQFQLGFDQIQAGLDGIGDAINAIAAEVALQMSPATPEQAARESALVALRIPLNAQRTALTAEQTQTLAGTNAALTAAGAPGTQSRVEFAESLAGTNALGATFRGRGSGYLCSGISANPTTPSTYVDISAFLGQNPNTVTVGSNCNNTTVLGGVNTFNYGVDNEAWALYWQGQIRALDNLNVTLGVRYTEDKRAAYLEYSPVNSGARINAKSDWENFTWDLSVDWQIIPEVNFYGRLATSYRAGGYNARANSAANFETPFDEENVASFELGVKSQFADNKVRLNVSAFYTQIKDAQVSTFSPSLAGATSIISNAGQLTNQGIEIELLAIPFTGFTLGLNYGFLDAEYDKFAEGNATLLAALQGNDPVVPYAPESNAYFYVDYQFPTYHWGQLGLRLDANYADAYTISPVVALDNPANDDTDRTLVNFRISLNAIPVRHGDFSVSLWSRNLTNEKYREFVIPFGAFDVATYGELRSTGLDIVYSY